MKLTKIAGAVLALSASFFLGEAWSTGLRAQTPPRDPTALTTPPDKQLPANQPPAIMGPHGPIDFGRTARQGTAFQGRADTGETVGRVTTYRGNVTISFPDTRAVLRADEVIFDEAAKQLTLNGKVHLQLDSK
jgi:lipopolysaccharide assembly outer membrane protein LptD (OstA)